MKTKLKEYWIEEIRYHYIGDWKRTYVAHRIFHTIKPKTENKVIHVREVDLGQKEEEKV
jgi:hypothetical protein